MEKWSKLVASFLQDRYQPPFCAPLPKSLVGHLSQGGSLNEFAMHLEHKIGFCYSREGL